VHLLCLVFVTPFPELSTTPTPGTYPHTYSATEPHLEATLRYHPDTPYTRALEALDCDATSPQLPPSWDYLVQTWRPIQGEGELWPRGEKKLQFAFQGTLADIQEEPTGELRASGTFTHCPMAWPDDRTPVF